jgi:IS30 family transposase
LYLRVRRAIEEVLNAKMAVNQNAVVIGRHRSAVYREFKSNRFEDAEVPYSVGTTA